MLSHGYGETPERKLGFEAVGRLSGESLATQLDYVLLPIHTESVEIQMAEGFALTLVQCSEKHVKALKLEKFLQLECFALCRQSTCSISQTNPELLLEF